MSANVVNIVEEAMWEYDLFVKFFVFNGINLKEVNP